jgi:lipoprotein signal peptidase
MNELFGKITSKDIRNILAVIIVLGSFILVYLVIIKAIPPENRDIAHTSLGFILGGAMAGVVGYYFGSSKNETDKAKKDGEQ